MEQIETKDRAKLLREGITEDERDSSFVTEKIK
jgi:hypothetical protein